MMFATKIGKSKLARRATALGIAGATAAGIGLCAAAPSQALVYDPGIVTQSVYFSRSETRAIKDHMNAGMGTVGAACVVLGLATVGTAGAACGVVTAPVAGVIADATDAAVNGNGCLRVRVSGSPYVPAPVTFLWAYNDGGVHCTD